MSNFRSCLHDALNALDKQQSPEGQPGAVFDLIRALDILEHCFQLPLLWECSRCHAAVGVSCSKPGGGNLDNGYHHGIFEAAHAPRQDVAVRAMHGNLSRAWTLDTIDDLVDGRKVDWRALHRKVKASPLARRVCKLIAEETAAGSRNAAIRL